MPGLQRQTRYSPYRLIPGLQRQTRYSPYRLIPGLPWQFLYFLPLPQGQGSLG